MEGAAARWQSQAGEVEQGLALLRFRWVDVGMRSSGAVCPCRKESAPSAVPAQHNVSSTLRAPAGCAVAVAGMQRQRTRCLLVVQHLASRTCASCVSPISKVPFPLGAPMCRLADLLSEVKWVLEDYSETEGADG